MPRPRKNADGLPARIYERHGARTYSIGYKAPDGTWEFRLKCPAGDKSQIQQLRLDAVRRTSQREMPTPADGTVASLIAAWFAWQEAKPIDAESRRADSTMGENRREANNLVKAFGHMRVDALQKSDAYEYLDACELASRSAKGNKEISLMRTILEYAVRKSIIKTNPFDGVERLKTSSSDRLVTDVEMALAVEIGRKMGGAYLIVALALRTAWLCVKRSVEVRALTVEQITDAGLAWKAAKRQPGQAQLTGLIEWSPELRKTIDEALTVKRHADAGEHYVFGNLRGQKYTKGGWKKMLSYVMAECVKVAEIRKIPFEKFSLQDCRPKGVTDKLGSGQKDTMDATMHTNEKMIRKIYDRRRVRVAKPVR